MELAPGTSVDRFIVEDLLGRGGMASVYRIRHRDLNVAYALKIMHVTHPDLAGRIKSEGTLQAELRHPNIVTVFDMIEISGVPALVMELVDGPSLAALLDVHRPSLDQVDDIVRGVLKGVRTAHAKGLIHRDLKPANVLLAHADDGYLPKITDFGLAKMLAGSTSAVQTRTGAVMGTPTYMAPEQFRNSRAVDARADVYSLGVMFYELAAGRRPYDAEDLFDLLDAVRNADYPRITELFPGIPDRMADAIEGAMTVDPNQRIPDVDTLYQVWCGKVRVEKSSIWDRMVLKQIGESLSNAPIDIATGLPRSQAVSDPAASAQRVLTPPMPEYVEPEPPDASDEGEAPAAVDDGTRFEIRPRSASGAQVDALQVDAARNGAEPAATEQAAEQTASPSADTSGPETAAGEPGADGAALPLVAGPIATDDVEPRIVADEVADPVRSPTPALSVGGSSPSLPSMPPLPPEMLHTRTVAPDVGPSLPPGLDPSLDGSIETTRMEPTPPRTPELHDSTPSLYLPPRPTSGASAPEVLPTTTKPGLVARQSMPPVEIRPQRSNARWLVLPVLVAMLGLGFAMMVISIGAATVWMVPGSETDALPPITILPPGGELAGTEPGTDEPGTDEPGTDEPGTNEPGTDEPGADEPGADEPGTNVPPPAPETRPQTPPVSKTKAKAKAKAKTPTKAPTGRGRVQVTGDAITIRLTGADGRSIGPGSSVPEGEYELRAVFPDQEVDQTATVTVRKGSNIVVHCISGFYSCTVK